MVIMQGFVSPASFSLCVEPSRKTVIAPPAVSLRLNVGEGLLGGKGGFGAMLRSAGKAAGSKKTTNFGACRDLHGRRLRHVNDQLALSEWKDRQEAQERKRVASGKPKRKGPHESSDEEDEDDDDTLQRTGIKGWYLGVPSWAEGIKPGKKGGSYMAPRRKTRMCSNWVQARKGRKAPEGAPAHWGCPRGRQCDFAHGEEELRGAGKKEAKAEKQRKAGRGRQANSAAYVAYDYNGDAAEMNSCVLEGLRNERKLKKVAKQARKAEQADVLPLDITKSGGQRTAAAAAAAADSTSAAAGAAGGGGGDGV